MQFGRGAASGSRPAVSQLLPQWRPGVPTIVPDPFAMLTVPQRGLLAAIAEAQQGGTTASGLTTRPCVPQARQNKVQNGHDLGVVCAPTPSPRIVWPEWPAESGTRAQSSARQSSAPRRRVCIQSRPSRPIPHPISPTHELEKRLRLLSDWLPKAPNPPIARPQSAASHRAKLAQAPPSDAKLHQRQAAASVTSSMAKSSRGDRSGTATVPERRVAATGDATGRDVICDVPLAAPEEPSNVMYTVVRTRVGDVVPPSLLQAGIDPLLTDPLPNHSPPSPTAPAPSAPSAPPPRPKPQVAAIDLKATGASAREGLEAGCLASELKAVGYSAADQLEAGCSASELKRAGFTAADVRQAGATAAMLREGGYTAAAARAAGFSAAELEAAGYTKAAAQRAPVGEVVIDEGKLVLFQAADAVDDKGRPVARKALYRPKSSSSQQVGSGETSEGSGAGGAAAGKSGDGAMPPRPVAMHRQQSMSKLSMAKSMKAFGETAKDGRDAGLSARDEREAGWSAAEVRAAGYSAVEMREGGFTAKEMRIAGLGIKLMRDAGFSTLERKQAGFFAAEELASGTSAADLKEAGFTAAELREAGCNPASLCEAGFSTKQLLAVACSATELKEAGCSAVDLKLAGCAPSLLSQAGYSSTQLSEAGFSESQINQVFGSPSRGDVSDGYQRRGRMAMLPGS